MGTVSSAVGMGRKFPITADYRLVGYRLEEGSYYYLVMNLNNGTISVLTRDELINKLTFGREKVIGCNLYETKSAEMSVHCNSKLKFTSSSDTVQIISKGTDYVIFFTVINNIMTGYILGRNKRVSRIFDCRCPSPIWRVSDTFFSIPDVEDISCRVRVSFKEAREFWTIEWNYNRMTVKVKDVKISVSQYCGFGC